MLLTHLKHFFKQDIIAPLMLQFYTEERHLDWIWYLGLDDNFKAYVSRVCPAVSRCSEPIKNTSSSNNNAPLVLQFYKKKLLLDWVWYPSLDDNFKAYVSRVCHEVSRCSERI